MPYCLCSPCLVTQTRERRCLGTELKGVEPKGVELEGVELEGADLKGADLGGADLEGVELEGAKLEQCTRTEPRHPISQILIGIMACLSNTTHLWMS